MHPRRSLWLAVLFVLLGSAAARAQGAPARWSGVYIGAYGGGAGNSLSYVELDDPDAAIAPEISGVGGGGLAGYARPLDRFLVGVEFDAGVAGGGFSADDGTGNGYSAFDLGWNSRLRGRVAYPRGRLAPFFATGLSTLRIRADDVDPEFGEGVAVHPGWTIGGGVDAALSPRLVLRAEYIHDDYTPRSHAINAPPGPFFPAYDIEVDSTVTILRVAVLYRF